MKKWLVFLLAVIVMVGSVTPCCIYDCQDELTTSSDTGESHEEGNCSPFFSCAACVGFVQVAKQVYVLQPTAPRPLHHEKLIVFFSSTYFSSFFQPPRSC